MFSVQDKYNCISFDNIKTALTYLESFSPILILCSQEFVLLNHDADIMATMPGHKFLKEHIENHEVYKNIPFVWLNRNTTNLPDYEENDYTISENVNIYLTYNKIDSSINLLKNYINKNLGLVDIKYWYSLMNLYQKNNNPHDFEKIANAFSHKFNIKKPEWADNLSHLSIPYTKQYLYINKPFTKEDLNRIIDLAL